MAINVIIGGFLGGALGGLTSLASQLGARDPRLGFGANAKLVLTLLGNAALGDAIEKYEWSRVLRDPRTANALLGFKPNLRAIAGATTAGAVSGASAGASFGLSELPAAAAIAVSVVKTVAGTAAGLKLMEWIAGVPLTAKQWKQALAIAVVAGAAGAAAGAVLRSLGSGSAAAEAETTLATRNAGSTRPPVAPVEPAPAARAPVAPVAPAPVKVAPPAADAPPPPPEQGFVQALEDPPVDRLSANAKLLVSSAREDPAGFVEMEQQSVKDLAQAKGDPELEQAIQKNLDDVRAARSAASSELGARLGADEKALAALREEARTASATLQELDKADYAAMNLDEIRAHNLAEQALQKRIAAIQQESSALRARVASSRNALATLGPSPRTLDELQKNLAFNREFIQELEARHPDMTEVGPPGQPNDAQLLAVAREDDAQLTKKIQALGGQVSPLPPSPPRMPPLGADAVLGPAAARAAADHFELGSGAMVDPSSALGKDVAKKSTARNATTR